MPEPDKNITTAYREVFKSYHLIADFITQFLGFLPLASGTSIFLLLDPKILTNEGEIDNDFLLPIGIFGFVITVGLFCYELRGIQRCNGLIELGKQLEQSLDVEGQFSLRPGKVGGFIGSTLAAQIIYPAVLSAWTFLAFSYNLKIASISSLFVFQGSFLGSFLMNLKVVLNDSDKKGHLTG